MELRVTRYTESDGYETFSFMEQQETEDSIKEIYDRVIDSGEGSHLIRNDHIQYLEKGKKQKELGIEGISHHFTSLDASKPWLIYWMLHSLDILKYQLGSELKQRCDLYIIKGITNT
jgi:protein farnesyltransferase subunit beta